MRVLFATTVIPATASSGGEAISSTVILGLRQAGCEVTVLGYLRPEESIEDADPNAVVAGRRPIETSASYARAAAWMARSLILRRPYTAEKFRARRYALLLRRALKEKQIDVVCIDHTQMAWLLDWLPDEMRVWLLMHNAESQLYAEGAHRQTSLPGRLLYRRESRKLRRTEKSAAARAERLFVLSPADGDAMRASVPNARLSVLPVTPEATEASSRISSEAHFDVALLGTWSWPPNRHALRWFIEKVYPRLPAGLSIHVAGRGAGELLAGLAGITYRGFVPNFADFLAGAKVFAVPTRYGGGVETKMLTAIASGLPIVATSTATRGLELLPPSVAISDDAATFARLLTERADSAAASMQGEAGLSWYRNRRAAFLAALGDTIRAIDAPVAGQRLDPAISRRRHASSVST